jgi:hypothetical protein
MRKYIFKELQGLSSGMAAKRGAAGHFSKLDQPNLTKNLPDC